MVDERAGLLLAALIVEAAVGYPPALHARLPHPVVWAGGAIARLERSWNRGAAGRRRLLGAVALVLLASAAMAAGLGLEQLLAGWPLSLAMVLVVTLGLAQRSLHDHVIAVARPLVAGDLAQARQAVAQIVGRDTQALDDAGVAAAAIESLAESLSDGVVAPAFWYLVAGLPGLFVYKLVNTADSMIGHRSERYLDYGWSAARVDDGLNLAPARLSAILLALAAGPRRGRAALGAAWKDAARHPSPNAGWPEAAMAGALRVRLGGPVSYGGRPVDRPWMGSGPDPRPADLARALRFYRRACLLHWLLVGALLWAA